MRPRHAVLPVIATAAIGAALLAVPAFAATRTVAVKGFAFKPSALTVKAGSTVVWRVGGDGVPHNVTVRSGPVRFHSRTGAAFTFSKRLTRKGTYRLVCTLHPGMHETISVR